MITPSHSEGPPDPEYVKAAIENADMQKAFLSPMFQDIKSVPFADMPYFKPHPEAEALLFLEAVLLFDPSKRLTAQQAIDSPYFVEMQQMIGGGYGNIVRPSVLFFFRYPFPQLGFNQSV